MTLGKRNNVRIDRLLPWEREYAFVDTAEYLADAILIRREIPVGFRKREFGAPGSPFVVVFCRFNRKHEEGFLEGMADLERKMLMSGPEGYGEFCDRVFGPIRGER